MSINTTLEAMKAKRDEAGEDGFTLIELLVVVVIIGILVAIAIPLYLNYRKGAENKSAESDVRGAISAVEQYYTSNGNAYPDKALKSGTGPTSLSVAGTTATNPQTATVSGGNTLAIVPKGTTGYLVCAQNADGQTVYTYDSTVGGAVTDNGKRTTVNFDTCAVS